MVDSFPSILTREDGFLEVTLKDVEEFDDYIYQQMQKDGGCLPCVRDHNNPCRLFYDTKGYVSLRRYLKSYTFENGESCAFLMYVLECMIRVNTTKPVRMDLDCIFVNYDGGGLRFLVLPVAVEQWVFQKAESQRFLTQIIKEIKVSQGYEAIGYLAYMQRFDEVTLPMILQGLHDVYEQHKPKQTFFERLLHVHEKVPYTIKDIPQPKSYPRYEPIPQICEDALPYQQKIHHETIALFKETQRAKLVDLEENGEYVLDKECFTIGRAKDNDLCIPQAYISSHHACIHLANMELEDRSSSNGTFVNQRAIHKIILQDQDIICFAKYSFRIELTHEFTS